MDKPLSERVAEYLQMSEAYGFFGMLDTQLIREQQAEIERLRNDLLDALDLKAGNGPTVLSMVVAERDRLRAENEALRADAERYRWLRDLEVEDPRGQIGDVPGDQWDAAIDAARSQS